VIGRAICIGFDSFLEASTVGIIFGWPKRHDDGVCGTRIDFRVFDLNRAYAGSSVIRRRGFLLCGDGRKNDLRPVRWVVHGLVRPSRPSNVRSSQRPDAHIPALRDTAHCLPSVRGDEAQAPPFPGGQSVLHQAICVLRRSALPRQRDQGDRRGVAAGLEYGQGAGQVVHAGAAPAPAHRGRR
jgi:hypothetical protein